MLKVLGKALQFYVWNLLIAFDQLANALLMGDPMETVSHRAGEAAKEGKDWGCLLCHLLDELDPRHCQSALERVTTNPGGSSVAALLTKWKKAQAPGGVTLSTATSS